MAKSMLSFARYNRATSNVQKKRRTGDTLHFGGAVDRGHDADGPSQGEEVAYVDLVDGLHTLLVSDHPDVEEATREEGYEVDGEIVDEEERHRALCDFLRDRTPAPKSAQNEAAPRSVENEFAGMGQSSVERMKVIDKTKKDRRTDGKLWDLLEERKQKKLLEKHERLNGLVCTKKTREHIGWVRVKRVIQFNRRETIRREWFRWNEDMFELQMRWIEETQKAFLEHEREEQNVSFLAVRTQPIRRVRARSFDHDISCGFDDFSFMDEQRDHLDDRDDDRYYREEPKTASELLAEMFRDRDDDYIFDGFGETDADMDAVRVSHSSRQMETCRHRRAHY